MSYNSVAIKRGEIEHHDAHAKEYDSAHNLETVKIKYLHNDFLKWLSKLNKNALVLELGGGTGNDAIKVAKRGFNIITSDISRKSLYICKEKFEKGTLMNLANFIIIDAEALPFIDESIDCVMIVATLHHFVNLNVALQEIYRCLKPGGYLIIGSEPNQWQFKLRSVKRSIIGRKLLKIFNKKYTIDKTSPADEITKGFKKEDLLKILHKSGFTVLEFNGLLYINGLINAIGMNLPALFEGVFLQFDKIIGHHPFNK